MAKHSTDCIFLWTPVSWAANFYVDALKTDIVPDMSATIKALADLSHMNELISYLYLMVFLTFHILVS